MKGINKVILIGYLGQNPEARYTAAGKIITQFNLATHNPSKKDSTNTKKMLTEWHRIKLFDRLAEIARDYLKQGHAVYLEGHLQTQTWDDKENKKYRITEVIGHRLELLERTTRDNEKNVLKILPKNHSNNTENKDGTPALI